MLAVGLMSGTSADGVDAAVLWTDGERVERFGPAITLPYAPALRREVLAVMADAGRAEHEPLTALAAELTAVNAAAARAVMGDLAVDVVGMHGQTVLHRPERGLTRQLGDGASLARTLEVTVVNRFRDADVAAAGQGAPLVPVFHRALLAGVAGPVAVLNIGGVANVTFVEGQRLVAFDTGPGNALLDDWVRGRTGADFDAEGAVAAAGMVDDRVLAGLLIHPYFDRPPPKSLDRHAFSIAGLDGLRTEDGAATLAAFTVQSVARAVQHLPAVPRRWLVGGGGRHNKVLMRRLREVLNVPVEPVEAFGWNGDALEAQAFAFLAVRRLRGLASSFPETTGVRQPVVGGTAHMVPGALRNPKPSATRSVMSSKYGSQAPQP